MKKKNSVDEALGIVRDAEKLKTRLAQLKKATAQTDAAVLMPMSPLL